MQTKTDEWPVFHFGKREVALSDYSRVGNVRMVTGHLYFVPEINSVLVVHESYGNFDAYTCSETVFGARIASGSLKAVLASAIKWCRAHATYNDVPVDRIVEVAYKHTLRNNKTIMPPFDKIPNPTPRKLMLAAVKHFAGATE